ncbi:NifU family protein, partial [Rickettsiales bacterium]|nr:NifU family protein [Rickettsiales bacterium]
AGDKTYEFKNKEQAFNGSKLAYDIFGVNGIESVFFGSNFITVSKIESASWDDLKTEILTTIMDFFVSGQPLTTKDIDNIDKKSGKSSQSNNLQSEISEEDSEIVKQIKELIEIKVRPAVAMDGGDIIYCGFEDGIVKLQLKGSCAGCPSSTITLKNGIENMLKHYIPEVDSVEQIYED